VSAAAAQAFAFPEQREPAFLRSFALAFLVHGVLIGVMFLGVHWQSRAPETVSVDLVELAPAPAPAPPKVEAAPPPPAPPKVEAAPPPPAKPDIAVHEKPKPKPRPVAKPAPRRDPNFERQLKQQLAMEQRAVAEQSRIAEEQRKERELQALLARQQQAARDRALAAWTEQITAKIRSRISVPAAQAVPGDPEAIFAVSLLPTAEVLTVRMTKSSGNKAYDEAVERAIIGSSPLPKPADPSVFQRQLELRFHPKDKPGS